MSRSMRGFVQRFAARSVFAGGSVISGGDTRLPFSDIRRIRSIRSKSFDLIVDLAKQRVRPISKDGNAWSFLT